MHFLVRGGRYLGGDVCVPLFFSRSVRRNLNSKLKSHIENIFSILEKTMSQVRYCLKCHYTYFSLKGNSWWPRVELYRVSHLQFASFKWVWITRGLNCRKQGKRGPVTIFFVCLFIVIVTSSFLLQQTIPTLFEEGHASILSFLEITILHQMIDLWNRWNVRWVFYDATTQPCIIIVNVFAQIMHACSDS